MVYKSTESGAATGTLQISPSSVAFGDVTIGQTASLNVSLLNPGTASIQISQLGVNQSSFSVSSQGNLPVTIAAGGSYALNIKFSPTAAGAATGQLTVSTNSSSTPSVSATLSGTGMAAQSSGEATLSGLSCGHGSLTGAGSDACTVTLNAAAGTGGLAVSLASSSSAVTVPASATVPAGAASIGFTATVSAVSTAQTVTLTAAAGGVSMTYALSLGAAVPALTLSATNIAFGDVDLNMPTTQTVTLTSSGTAPLTVSTGSVTGTGFSLSGVTFPVTLNPSQTATLDIEFDPAAAGAATGNLTLTSNASPPTTSISLSGSGATVSYQVNLNWNAPTSSTDPVAGYNIYRAAGGSSSYQLLNASPDASTAYTDTTVQNNISYTYYVESVDAEGNQSTPSNTYSVNIP